MNFEDIIYDVSEITKQSLGETEFNEYHVAHMVNSYRALFIRRKFDETAQIDPQWLLPLGVIDMANVDLADDLVTQSSIKVSKGIFPAVVTLPYNLGYYRLSGISRHRSLAKISIEELILKIETNELVPLGYGYAVIFGKTVYAYPSISAMTGVVIAENPLEVQIQDGKVWRARTILDPYPVDIAMAQEIVLSILTKDLAISNQQVADIIQNSQSDLKMMKSGISPAQS
jgi:hypothetical protein